MVEQDPALTRRVGGRESVARNALHLLAISFFAIALEFALVAWLLGDSFYLRLATEALIYGLLALSVDILLGYTGLLTLGQALYFGLGAYTSALVLKHVTPSFWAGDRGESVDFGGGRPDRRLHCNPRARRILRPDHLRPRAGGRQGDLQYARSGRFRRHHWHTGHRHRLSSVLGQCRRSAGVLPASAGGDGRPLLRLVVSHGHAVRPRARRHRSNEKRVPFLGYSRPRSLSCTGNSTPCRASSSRHTRNVVRSGTECTQ
jgi:Branched-chain amino acid transport system / permease component